MNLMRRIVRWVAVRAGVADDIADGVCRDLRAWITDDAGGASVENLRALIIIEMYSQARIGADIGMRVEPPSKRFVGLIKSEKYQRDMLATIDNPEIRRLHLPRRV